MAEPTPSYPFGLGASDLIALAAFIVSVASIFLNIYISYLNKRLEIRFLKFSKVLIENLDELINPLENFFSEHPSDPASNHLPQITEALVDIELFLVHLSPYYPSMDISKFSDSKDKFSDHLYNNSSASLKDSKIPYLAFKTHIYSELYDYARRSSVGPLDRIWANIKAWWG